MLRLARRTPLLWLCLGGAAVRFATLGQQSLWFDEAATARLMRMGLGAMLRALPDAESTPPLYYLLAWLWARLLGTSEVALRSLPAVLGTLTIAVVYAAGARLLGRRAGLAAAALAAFSPLLIWYSQEARAYALLVALSAASLWALAAALEPGARGRAPVVWAAVCALAVTTHYFAVFVVAPQAVWLLRARGRAAAPAVGGVLLAGCALLPLALHQRAQGGADFIARSPLATRLGQAAKQLLIGYDTPGQIPLAVLAALVLAALAGSLVRGPTGPARGRGLGLAAIAGAAVAVPAVLALLGLDYVITRNVIGAWVPAALAVAAGGALAGVRAGPALVAAACALGLAATLGIALDARFQRDDWRGAARTVPAGSAAALVVTPASGRLPLAYYLPASRALPATGAAVATVEVIGLAVRGVGAPLRSPALSPAPPALGGFTAPVVRRGDTFSLLYYRARGAAVVVTPAMLAPLALIAGGPATLLVDGAG